MYSASAPLHHRRTTPTNSSVASSSTNHVYDHDVERYLQDSMGQFLPQSSAYSRSSTQLDWELGDIPEKRRFANAAAEAGTMFPGTRDDNVWNDSEHDNDDDLVDDDDLIEEEIFKSSASSSAVDDESYEQFHDPQPNHMQNESSSTAADQSDLRRPRKQRTIRELLASFNPIKPPTVSDSATHEEGLEELQLWLECEAQQEAVLRYQKVIDDARERKDFSSLSMVQRQIVQWFGPLQEAIESRQLNYLKGQKAEPSEKKFGPFICTLPPSKLAVIVAHEAVMKSIVNGQENSTTYSVLGVSLASMAMRIGQAVEDELVVHRLLHKRSQDAARETKARTAPTDFEQNVSAVFGSDESEGDVDLVESDDLFNGEGVNATDAIEMADTIVSDNLPNVTHKWSYASSHLNVYLEEISRYQPSAKKRRVTGYAIQRARQILEREDEWTDNEKMQLGAALLQPLLETAKITTQDQKSEAAFTLEKHWVAKDKSVSFVCMSDRLHKMIQTDKLESLSATTTRHKPMIVPPKPWSSATDGGYRALKVDLIRYHGCHTQREAVKNADNSVVFDGLNALGRVKWKINKRMLKVAQKCWTDNIPLGDIPSRTDLEVPEEPVQPAWNEIKPEKGTEEYQNSLENYRAYRESLAKYNRTKQKNMVSGSTV